MPLRGFSQGVHSALSCAPPTGVLANDVLVAAVYLTDQTSTLTPPTGWTQLASDQFFGIYRLSAYRRTATSSEPASYTWTVSGTTPAPTADIGMIAYYQLDPTTPVDGLTTNTGSGLTATASSVQCNRGNEVLLALVAIDSSQVLSGPAGMTQEAGFGYGLYFYDQQLTAIAASGDQSFTLDGSNNWAAYLVGLQPPADSAVPTPGPWLLQSSPVYRQ